MEGIDNGGFAIRKLVSAAVYLVSFVSILLYLFGIEWLWLDLVLIALVIADNRISEFLFGKGDWLFDCITCIGGIGTYLIMDQMWNPNLSIPIFESWEAWLIVLFLFGLLTSPFLAVLGARRRKMTVTEHIEEYLSDFQAKFHSVSKKVARDGVQRYRLANQGNYYIVAWLILSLMALYAIAIALLSFALGVIAQLGIGLFLISISKAIVAKIRKKDYDFPLDESFMLESPDIGSVNNKMLAVVPIIIATFQLGRFIPSLRYGVSPYLLLFAASFFLLLVVSCQQVYYLNKITPSRNVISRGSNLSLIFVGILFGAIYSLNFLYVPITIVHALVVLSVFYMVTVYAMTRKTRPKDFHFLIQFPVLFFLSASFQIYIQLLAGIMILLLWGIVFVIIQTLISVHHLIEYPLNLVYYGILFQLIIIVVLLRPIEYLIRIIISALVFALELVVLYNLTWHKFKRTHLTDPVTREILWWLVEFPKGTSSGTLSTINGSTKQHTRATLKSLIRTGIIKVKSSFGGPFYMIRSNKLFKKIKQAKNQWHQSETTS